MAVGVFVLVGAVAWLFFSRGNSHQASRSQIETSFAQIADQTYALPENLEASAWSLVCVLESISYLKQGNYIEFGNYAVRATGQCSYLDVNRERQTVTIALVVQYQDENIGSTWWPAEQSIAPGTARTDDLVQQSYELFWDSTGKPGDVVTILFGWPNPINRADMVGAEHHGDLIPLAMTREQLEAFVQTKDPTALPEKLLIPFHIQRSEGVL